VLLIVLWVRSYWTGDGVEHRKRRILSDAEMIALFNAKSGEFQDVVDMLNNEPGPLVIFTDGEIAVWDTSEHGAELQFRPRTYGEKYASLFNRIGLNEVGISPLRTAGGLVNVYQFHPQRFSEGFYWKGYACTKTDLQQKKQTLDGLIGSVKAGETVYREIASNWFIYLYRIDVSY
jgi:hypothetical protein